MNLCIGRSKRIHKLLYGKLILKKGLLYVIVMFAKEVFKC